MDSFGSTNRLDSAKVLLLWATRVLTVLALLATIAALVLHIRPIEYSSSSDGTATIGSIWASWTAVATCAGIAMFCGALTVLLRKLSP